MKNFTTFLLVFMLSIGAAVSQTPTITMVSSAAVGSTMTISFSSIYSAASIDFGDGSPMTTGGLNGYTHALGATKTITITGGLVTDLVCSNNQLTSLDVSKYTTITSIICSGNKLTTLDISKNVTLQNLDCQNNLLTSLDLSKNTQLQYLTCNDNQITTLNTSSNPSLSTLYCFNNQLTTLNLSLNASLNYLYCYNNLLTTLDVSACTNLNELQCYNNLLSTLVVTSTNMSKLFCYNNKLTFASMPIPKTSWSTYTYNPQAAVSISKITGMGNGMDLSSQYTINSKTTVYAWNTKSGKALVLGTDYNITNGKTTFLKTQTDSVYCIMTNATFPNLTLTTTCTKITPATISMTTKSTVGSSFSLILKANANSTIQVDFGNGALVSKAISTSATTISGNTVGTQSLYVYGSGITSIDCSSSQLSALNVTNDTTLTDLNCNNNQLTTLDVSKNVIQTLNCNYNLLNTLNVSTNTALVNLDCSGNQLSTLNVSNNRVLAQLDCSGNLLSALDISKNTALTVLKCKSNKLNFASLPLKQTAWTTYTYAPQNPMSIAKTIFRGVNFDLSSQLSINNNTTAYSWSTKSGSALVQNTDFTLNNGLTNFQNMPADSVYCLMTNATFPDFTGSNALRTTNAKITPPTAVENKETANIDIYAANQTLYVNVPYNTQLSIFDMSGKMVISKIIYSGLNSLQLQNAGVYIIKLTNNKGTVVQKIMIEK
jgi:Leucine-rich repeat (LRR) protein